MEQIKDVMKQVVSCLASQTANMESLDGEEFKNACDGVKDLAMAKYYCAITDAMEESEYGVDYDENGRKHYTPIRTNSTRAYYPHMRYYENPIDSDAELRMQAETKRMHDYDNGRMYYTPMESTHDRMVREYTESKTMNPEDKAKHTEKLRRLLDDLEQEIKPMIPSMGAEEKTMTKQRFANWQSLIM